ncbi:PREDICTED: uncharacterized protein LOC109591071 [Amphimedon queenslandica]|uniref:Paired domain-containing protein n=1 Tax=Amphimedon queenslandica TaxID=400682 RepID=A0A1X7SX11_AMPQE|nr:PREDICTED: uncharacterized protein LOC109591071 [Amphimedon queenslandica]|eukprot:XP_019862436.1 PREDICTED: uncharacterized protein LOC109591071 [Amphimedon queenslandica]
MADNVELDDEQLLRKLLETIARGKGDSSSSSEGIQESVAQLLAAALNQVSQETGSGDILASNEVEINNVDNTVEVPSSSAPTGGIATAERQKNLGIKFSPEIRRTIVNYRKGGKRYRDIAKELGASVSGVQKVWERFLSTGTIGDRKPSLPVGRPRKFGKTGDVEPSLPSTEEREGEEYIETSATGECPLQAVLITDDNNIEEPMDVPGATVEVVATTTNSNQPASVTEKKSTKRKITTPTYREELLLK